MNLAEARAAVDAAITRALDLALRAGRTGDSVDVARVDFSQAEVEVAVSELVEVAQQTLMEPVTIWASADHLSNLRIAYDEANGA